MSDDDTPSPVELGSRRELFVDNFLVQEFTGGAQLRLHHPVPRDIAIVHDEPWEGSGCGYHTVFRDGDMYRMYYRGLNMDLKKQRQPDLHEPYYCYAESEDGVNWRKPDLGIVEFEGSRSNNIILKGLGTHNFTPFKDRNPGSPEESRYKALGGIKKEGGLYAFRSPDGIHWSLMADEPVITKGAFDSQNLAFWDQMIGKYRAYWRFFAKPRDEEKEAPSSGYRAIRTATSSDFLNWTGYSDLKYEDSPQEHMYTNQIKPYYRAPHILIGFPTRYVDRGWSDSTRALPELEKRELRASNNRRYGTAVTEGLVMASRDGVRFKRWNEAFMRPGIQRPGTWYYGHQYIAWHVVETRSKIKGAPNQMSIYANEGCPTGVSTGVRRYTLRVDGFVSLWAPYKGGEMVTKPLTFTGGELVLNFSTSAAGRIRVEIQRPDGEPFQGFSLQECGDVFGDELERRVTWDSGKDLGDLAGRSVRLRFALRDADLYSFQFVE